MSYATSETPVIRRVETFRGFPIVAPFFVLRKHTAPGWAVYGTAHGPSAFVIAEALTPQHAPRVHRNWNNRPVWHYRTKREATAAMRAHCYS